MTSLVLLSGGVDSAVLLAFTPQPVHAVTFRYGQRHHNEVDAAVAIADGVPHTIVNIDLTALNSPLVGGSTRRGASPYVPARNTVFLAYAIGLAETLGATRIRIGATRDDHADFPDCRLEYFHAVRQLIPYATNHPRLIVDAPFVTLTKTDVIRLGARLGVDFAATTSCYDPAPAGACGLCDACLLRRRSFKEAGVDDPARYR